MLFIVVWEDGTENGRHSKSVDAPSMQQAALLCVPGGIADFAILDGEGYELGDDGERVDSSLDNDGNRVVRVGSHDFAAAARVDREGYATRYDDPRASRVAEDTRARGTLFPGQQEVSGVRVGPPGEQRTHELSQEEYARLSPEERARLANETQASSPSLAGETRAQVEREKRGF